MTTEEIIKDNIGFLINEYNFVFTSNSNGKEEWFYFSNNYGSINYYIFEPAGEYELSITINGKGKIVLDSFKIVSNSLLQINKKMSLLEFVFEDHRKIYWNKISKAFKTEIKKSGTLYGLNLEKKFLK